MLRVLASTKSYTQSGRLRVFILSLMILVVPLFAYFSMHVSSRTSYFNDRNFRQLRSFSRQITDRINNLGTVFKNSVDKFVKPPEVASKSGNNTQTGSKSGNDTPRTFQDYLNVLKSDGTNFTAPPVDPTLKVEAKTVLGLPSIKVVNQDAILWLEFDCAVTPSPAGSPTNNAQTSEAGTVHFTAKTDFDQLIKPLISKTDDEGLAKGDIGEDFDHIIIARADNGKVLFQQANGDLSITSLDHISLADSPDKALDLAARSKTTDAADVTIAGARYKLYVQPIEIALSTKDSESPETLWVVCGLVEAGRFRYQTWAISYTVLIISGFIAGLLLLSWPFIKLIFIGPKDRLRVAEPYMLAVSVIIAGALLTFFTLFIFTYRALEDDLDAQLNNLADSIQKHFQDEVENALKEIDSLEIDRDLAERTLLLKCICEEGKCDSQTDPYPYFKTAFWIDAQGQQLAKWSISKQTTNLVPVVTRAYFSKLRDGYYRELKDHKFWLEPVSSKNTGGFTVVISKEIKLEEPDKAAKPAKVATPDKAALDRSAAARFVAIDTNLMSLMKPAMVAGFGYRIIDANGDVIFPQIKENFFAECDNDHQLRSAVSGHLNEFVSVPYLGRDSRLYVRPINGLPDWTLVVFRDKEPLRSTNLEIVALSASLFLIYLFPFLLILAIMFLISHFRGKRMKWLWPTAGFSPIYLQSIPISALFTFVAYKLSYRLPDYGLILLLSLVSVAALLLLFVQLKYNLALKPSVRLASYLERRWLSINYRSLYALCLVALVLVIGVLPSVTFFRLAYNEEMGLFIKYGQVTLVNSLNEREERVRAAYPINIFENSKAAGTFINARLDENLDRYYAFFFDTKITRGNADVKASEETQGTLLLALSKLIPFSSQSSIVRHGLIRNQSADDHQSADNLWQWSGGESGKLTVTAPEGSAKSKGSMFLNIESTTPRFTLHPLPWALFMAAIIPILFLLIRFILNRVFLLEAIETSSSNPKESILSGARRLFVVLGSPYTRRDSLLQQPDLKVLNLKREAVDGQWLEKFNLDKFLREASSESIAIDCFEYQINEPRHNLLKLYLLEKLITHHGTLVIASTAEPADYLFDSVDKSEHHEGTADASARWARVMSNFWVDYREDSGEPEAFKAELKEIRGNNRDEADAAITSNERIEELYAVLERECAPRACLQDIGREIAQRRDFEKSDPDQVIEEVLVQARTYYKFVWESCSPGEKLTLAHLATDGLLTPNDPDIPRLVRRGLIVRDPVVRLINESFRLFVLTESPIDNEVAVTESEARKGSNWQYMKVALVVTVVVIMVFLFATQRDLYNSSLVALTSIAAGVPTVFSFFNLFQNKGGASRSPS
jgi:hypothetical protein